MRQDTGSQVPARIIREPVCYGSRNKENGFHQKHQQTALEIARRSIVLLKTRVCFPLTPESSKDTRDRA